MNTNKIRKEITFNTKEEHTIYHDFKKMCNKLGVNETSMLRLIMKEKVEKYKKENKK